MKYSYLFLVLIGVFLSGCLDGSGASSGVSGSTGQTAGSSQAPVGSSDQSPPSAVSSSPKEIDKSASDQSQLWSMVFDSTGRLFVADRGLNKIIVIDQQGQVSDFAGSGVQGELDGVGTQAQFSFPASISVDSEDNLYAGDWNGTWQPVPSYRSIIRKITPEGAASTIASLPVLASSQGEIVVSAIDSNDNLLVATSYEVWKIDQNGVVTAFAGAGSQGHIDGVGASARFEQILDMTADDSDNLWIVDAAGCTYGNDPGDAGCADGIANFYPLAGASGCFYTSIKKIDSSGAVTTVFRSSQGVMSSITFLSGSLYMLVNSHTGDVIKYEISSGASSTPFQDVFNKGGGGPALVAHPSLGLIIAQDSDSLLEVPWPQ